jgi:hypothetical protein
MGCGSSSLTNDNNLIRNRHISSRNANNNINRKPVSNTVLYIQYSILYAIFLLTIFEK